MSQKPEPIFEKALAAAGAGEIYLGNIEAVTVIVRSFIGDAAETMTGGGREGRVLSLAGDMALRFAQGAAGDALIPGWHTRPQLGLYAAKHWSIDPNQSLVDILRTMFLLAIGRVAEAIVAESKGNDEQARFMIDVLVEELAATLTGIWEATYPPDEDE